MKIGICTCYDNHNYGSMLQAYATYVKFVELGYDCEFLCYRKKLNMIQKIKWLPRLLNKYLMKEKFRLIEKKIQLKKHPDIKMKDAIRQRAFDRFLENFLKDKVSAPYIGFEALKAGSKNYDVVVAGGDQLWIPAGLPTNFFNLMFADEKVKRVSYSTSFGVTEVPFYQKRRTIEYKSELRKSYEDEWKKYILTIKALPIYDIREYISYKRRIAIYLMKISTKLFEGFIDVFM